MPHPTPLTVAILILALTLSPTIADSPAPPLKITCQKQTDSIVPTTADGKTLLDLKSPGGIGSATITRQTKHWPQPLILRLHLQGLEFLTLSTTQGTLKASVLSHSGNTRLLHWSKDKSEGPRIDAKSPYWTDILVLNAEGKPIEGLPNDGGWFELIIPAAMLPDDVESIELAWINFYR